MTMSILFLWRWRLGYCYV